MIPNVNSVEDISAALVRLPDEIRANDEVVATWRAKITEAKQTLELAEANAGMRVEGKNAEERKASRDKIMAFDPDVLAAKKELRDLEYHLDVEEANNKSLGRQFVAVCHIAELHAANFNFRAKASTK